MTHHHGTGPDRTAGTPEDQMDLLDLLDVDETEQTTAEAFEAYHQTNKHVYDCLVRLARRWAVRTGNRRQSIRRLVEIARWDEGIRTGEEPEINDHFAAYYARLIMAREKDLAGAFETRRSAADQWIDGYLSGAA